MAVSQDHAPAITAVTSGQSHTPGPTQALLAHLSMIEWALMEASSSVLPEHEAARAAALRWLREEGPQGAYGLLFGAEPELLDGCNALVGLIQLITGRDDLPADIRSAMLDSHRLADARAAIAQATGGSNAR